MAENQNSKNAAMNAAMNASLEESLARIAKVALTNEKKGAQVGSAKGCALKSQAPCCGGRGYKLARDGGAHFRAEVCTCVNTCGECFGKTRIVEDGVSKPCKSPSPVQVAHLISSASLPTKYIDANFEAALGLNSGNARATANQMRKWATEYRRDHAKGMVITGPIGIGKTWLLVAAGKILASRGFSVRYAEFCQLLGDLKAGFAEGEAESSVLEPLLDVDVLILDEVGMGRNTDWERTIIDNLVSGRYNRNKTILAATNFLLQDKPATHAYNIDLERDYQGRSDFNPDQFGPLEPRIGARVYSRLHEMTTFVEMTGANLRKFPPSGSPQSPSQK